MLPGGQLPGGGGIGTSRNNGVFSGTSQKSLKHMTVDMNGKKIVIKSPSLSS